MFKTGDLFECESKDLFASLLSELSVFGTKTSIEQGFPDYFFKIEKKTPKSGVNYVLTLNEIPFPYTMENGKDKMVSNSIARIEEKGAKSRTPGCILVYVNYGVIQQLKPHSAVSLKPVSNHTDDATDETIGYNILLDLHSQDTASFLKDVIRWKVESYVPSMPTFGCCDRYLECSKEGRCVRDNPFYFRACQYRKNLLAGKVFYGKM